MTTYASSRRCELLATGEGEELIGLAERIMRSGVEPLVVAEPRTGIVVMQVREPVAEERFHLGEVLATTAEVALGEHRGWCGRLGSDREATLAAAVLDAVAEIGGPLAHDIEALCVAIELRAAERSVREWQELAPTEVRFEELDA